MSWEGAAADSTSNYRAPASVRARCISAHALTPSLGGPCPRSGGADAGALSFLGVLLLKILLYEAPDNSGRGNMDSCGLGFPLSEGLEVLRIQVQRVPDPPRMACAAWPAALRVRTRAPQAMVAAGVQRQTSASKRKRPEAGPAPVPVTVPTASPNPRAPRIPRAGRATWSPATKISWW